MLTSKKWVAVVVTVAAFLTPTIVQAEPAPRAAVGDPVADGLAGPLQFAIRGRQQVLVGQSFGGVLTRIDGAEDPVDLVVVPRGEVSGVAAKKGSVYYAASTRRRGAVTSAGLFRFRNGREVQIADLLRVETNRNPDRRVEYGFVEIADECAALLPEEVPASYTGLVDSHPYAVAVGKPGIFVAEAGGNTILSVLPSGRVETLAVLPPVEVEVSEAAAETLGLPDCAIGLVYRFEAVPTDVEIGRDGMLYVSALGGGPEDDSLDPRGTLWRIDPESGAMELMVEGLAGPTNVAVSRAGVVFVAELYTGRVSRVVGDGLRTVAEVSSPAGLEWSHGTLWVSYDVFGNGSVARIDRS